MWLSVAFFLVIAGLIVATACVRWARTRRAARQPNLVAQRDRWPDLGAYAAVVVTAGEV